MDDRDALIKLIWSQIISETDLTEIKNININSDIIDSSPMGDLGALVNKFINAGITYEDLARYTKLMQYQTAYGIMYGLGDATNVLSDAGFDCDIEYAVVSLDENDQAQEEMGGIHEQLLSGDPTGRELRPGDAQQGNS